MPQTNPNIHTIHSKDAAPPPAPAGPPRPGAPKKPTALQKAYAKDIGNLYSSEIAKAQAGPAAAPLPAARPRAAAAPAPGPAPLHKKPFVTNVNPRTAPSATAVPRPKPLLAGTQVRGTGRAGQPIQQATPGRVTVSSERGFGKAGAKVGKKGRAAALDAAEKRLSAAAAASPEG